MCSGSYSQERGRPWAPGSRAKRASLGGSSCHPWTLQPQCVALTVQTPEPTAPWGHGLPVHACSSSCQLHSRHSEAESGAQTVLLCLETGVVVLMRKVRGRGELIWQSVCSLCSPGELWRCRCPLLGFKAVSTDTAQAGSLQGGTGSTGSLSRGPCSRPTWPHLRPGPLSSKGQSPPPLGN